MKKLYLFVLAIVLILPSLVAQKNLIKPELEKKLKKVQIDLPKFLRSPVTKNQNTGSAEIKVLDSLHEYSGVNGEWVLDTRQLSAYGNAGQPLSDTFYHRDEASGNFYISEVTTYAYTPDQVIVLTEEAAAPGGELMVTERSILDLEEDTLVRMETVQSWDAMTMAWINAERNFYEYDESNRLDSIYSEFWDFDAESWEPDQYVKLSYFDGELVDSVWGWAYDPLIEEFVLESLTTFSYNENGDDTAFKIFVRDEVTMELDLVSQELISYNEQGQATLSRFYIKLFTDELDLVDSTLHFYGVNGFPALDSVFTVDLLTDNFTHTSNIYFQHDEDGDLIMEREFDIDETGQEVASFRTDWFYSTRASTSVKEAFAENLTCQWPNPMSRNHAVFQCEWDQDRNQAFLQISDLTGRRIAELEVNSGSHYDLNLQDLSNGIYVFSLVRANALPKSWKVMLYDE